MENCIQNIQGLSALTQVLLPGNTSDRNPFSCVWDTQAHWKLLRQNEKKKKNPRGVCSWQWKNKLWALTLLSEKMRLEIQWRVPEVSSTVLLYVGEKEKESSWVCFHGKPGESQGYVGQMCLQVRPAVWETSPQVDFVLTLIRKSFKKNN